MPVTTSGGNNNDTGVNTETVCATSLTTNSSDADLLQQTMDETAICSQILQTASTGIQEILYSLQQMKILADQATSGLEPDYTALNSEFSNLILSVQASVENAKYNELSLLTGDAQIFNYTIAGSSVECIDTSIISMDEVTAAIAPLSVADLTASENSEIVLDDNISKINHMVQITNLISSRVSQDAYQAQNIKSIVDMPPAANICDFIFMLTDGGIHAIEQIIDTTRQNFASFTQMNPDINSYGYQVAVDKTFQEMYTAINNSLVISSINGAALFKGSNKYTDSCFAGQVYDLQLEQLGLQGLSASNQTEVVQTIQKLDAAIALIEAKKIELGISDADVDYDFTSVELERLMAHQQAYPEDTCTSFNIAMVMRSVSLGKVVTKDKTLSSSSKIYAPLPNNINTTVQSASSCISILQTTDGVLSDISNMVSRILELSNQSKDGDFTPEQRQMIQNEVDSLVSEITRIKNEIAYENWKLLNGEDYLLKYFSDRTIATCFNPAEFDINNILNNLATVTITTQQDAAASIDIIDQARKDVTTLRAKAGAYTNKLTSEVNLYQIIQQFVASGLSIGPTEFCYTAINVANSGVTTVSSTLQSIKLLAELSAEPSTTDEQRSGIQIEATELLKFITLTNAATMLNENTLISGDSALKNICFGGKSFDARNAALGITDIDLSTQEGAVIAASLVQDALTQIDGNLF